MKRPASFVVPAFIFGLWLAMVIPASSIFVTGGVLLITCFGLLQFDGCRFVVLLVMVGVLLGFVRMQHHQTVSPIDSLTAVQENHEMIRLEALVLDHRRVSGHTSRYQAEIRRITTDAQAHKTRIPVILQQRDYDGILFRAAPGAVISIESFILTHDLRERQQEPYLASWRSQGFHAVLTIPASAMTVTHAPASLRSAAFHFRERSENIIDVLLPEPENRVMKSLFFGNQGYLNASLHSLFTRTGTAHLIAVSGLHVGILALFSQLTLGKLGAGKIMARMVTVMLVWFYAAMAGFPVSILRAGTMYTLYAMALPLERRYDAKSMLLWSGMLFLWLNPLTMYSVSFQLSFAAAASIVWLYPRLKKRASGFAVPGIDLLLVALVAQLGTWPIIASHFGTLSMVSLPANVLIVPMISVLMPLGLIMTFLGFFSPLLAAGPAFLVEGGIRYLLKVAGWFHRLPFAEVMVPPVHPGGLTGYYLLLVVMCWRLKQRGVEADEETTSISGKWSKSVDPR